MPACSIFHAVLLCCVDVCVCVCFDMLYCDCLCHRCDALYVIIPYNTEQCTWVSWWREIKWLFFYQNNDFLIKLHFFFISQKTLIVIIAIRISSYTAANYTLLYHHNLVFSLSCSILSGVPGVIHSQMV